MAGQQEIIKEYLVKLGFIVDKQGQHDFDAVIEGGGKKIKVFTKTLMAAAAAIAGMATSFALSMDRLYYASQKAYSSASNLKALEFAGRQIGMTAEAVDQMVGSLVMTLRTDPGMAGWIRSLGVDASEARQGVDIWMDLIDKLREKPFYEGAQFAEMVGMSPDQLFQVEANLDRFKKAAAERLKMEKDSGLDQDKAAEEGRDLANKFGELSEKFGIWIDKIDSSILPKMDSIIGHMDKLFGIVDRSLRFLTGDATAAEKQSMAESPWWAKHDPKTEQQPPTSFLGKEPAWMDRLNDLWFKKGSQVPAGSPPAAKTFETLERMFNLDPGSLDHIWKKESNRSDPRFMLSSKGAAGPFGFMPGTAAQYGVTDRYDFQNSSQGAAHYLSDLKKEFGSTELAMQAYNWGPEKMRRYLGAKAQGKAASMPAETRQYTAGPTYNSITINESKTPKQTADAVAKGLDRQAADQQRYLTGNTR